jgi:Rha family phage regulatory protein
MNQVPVLNFQDFIAADGEALFTTSQQVAAAFGKPHYDVLKSIRGLCADLPQDRLGNFSLAVEMRENPSGGALIASPCYRITRDGFTWLAMRFRGKKALAFQVAYTDAFNAMASFIKNQRDGLRYRCMEKELECKDSARRGSFHGRGLNLRKQEKPVLESELSALLAQAQPSLRLN